MWSVPGTLPGHRTRKTDCAPVAERPGPMSEPSIRLQGLALVSRLSWCPNYQGAEMSSRSGQFEWTRDAGIASKSPSYLLGNRTAERTHDVRLHDFLEPSMVFINRFRACQP